MEGPPTNFPQSFAVRCARFHLLHVGKRRSEDAQYDSFGLPFPCAARTIQSWESEIVVVATDATYDVYRACSDIFSNVDRESSRRRRHCQQWKRRKGYHVLNRVQTILIRRARCSEGCEMSKMRSWDLKYAFHSSRAHS